MKTLIHNINIEKEKNKIDKNSIIFLSDMNDHWCLAKILNMKESERFHEADGFAGDNCSGLRKIWELKVEEITDFKIPQTILEAHKKPRNNRCQWLNDIDKEANKLGWIKAFTFNQINNHIF